MAPVVLAEVTLDMLRLGYADLELAQRAVLSLFPDVPSADLPCVFQDGRFNMVARDGSPRGTAYRLQLSFPEVPV